MYIYLPVTEMSIHILWLIALGGGVGFLSGLLGVSGGFMMTPMLILLGIPSPIAVASQSAGVIATCTTGVMGHWRRGNVDFKMAFVLIFGGLIGSSVGVFVFTLLNNSGQLDLVIKISYIIFLSGIGTMMLWELLRTNYRVRRRPNMRQKIHVHNWTHRLPFRVRFRKSRLYISIILPLILGGCIGFLSALMGVGGGFIMVPAMIYLLGMHTSIVVGTSLLQSIIVAINATYWQASVNHTVDVILAGILIVGGVVGASLGTAVSGKLKAEQLRLILAIIVLGLGLKLFIDLVFPPSDLYMLTSAKGAW